MLSRKLTQSDRARFAMLISREERARQTHLQVLGEIAREAEKLMNEICLREGFPVGGSTVNLDTGEIQRKEIPHEQNN